MEFTPSAGFDPSSVLEPPLSVSEAELIKQLVANTSMHPVNKLLTLKKMRISNYKKEIAQIEESLNAALKKFAASL